MKGKNLTKKLMSILLVLISIAVIVIAFVGIYLPKLNKLSNIIPNYKLGTEMDGIIEYRFYVDDSEEEKQVYVDSDGKIRGEVIEDDTSLSTASDEDTEESEPENNTGFDIETRTIKANEDSVLTSENFEKVKRILQKRLENAKATEYAIRMDEVTGNMVIELSQNDNISYLYQVALTAMGRFNITDAQTGVILIEKDHLVSANETANYDDTSGTYTISLQLTLDKEGTELLKEISKNYNPYTDEEGTEQYNCISINVNDESIRKTYFTEEYTNSTLTIPIYQNVSASDLNFEENIVKDIAYTLNNDELPIKYKTPENALFIQSSVDKGILSIFNYVMIGLLIVITVYFVIKYQFKGLLAGIFNATLVGLVILAVRCFANVTLSISSMVAFIGVVVINFVFMIMYLNNIKKGKEKSYRETLKSFYGIMFPIIVIAFIFTFFVSATVAGLGSVLFWGLLLQIIFNTIIVKYVLENK